MKDHSYAKPNSVNPLYLIINKIGESIEESNANKYLMLVPTDESKDILQKYDELWTKVKDLIRSITNNSDDYDKKYMKIKFNSYDILPPKKTPELHNMVIIMISVFYELHNMVIIIRCVFHQNNKYYPQVFLGKCLYRL